ncbi:hypothetical protein [Nocardia anaemiae]|uniref:hypothetical protein n=1 Tax=Nocardia anaemiae TaxID=263910 RepID=UPI0007A532EA|nr:hypothetical protein [Nocardia anaemiae]
MVRSSKADGQWASALRLATTSRVLLPRHQALARAGPVLGRHRHRDFAAAPQPGLAWGNDPTAALAYRRQATQR